MIFRVLKRYGRQRLLALPGVRLSFICLSAFTASAQTASVTLAWNASTSADVVSYNLYSGPASGSYTNVTSPGLATNATVSGLVQGATYYFAVTAISSAGLESAFSTQVGYTVPLTNTTAASTAPVIVLTAPLAGSTYPAPATLNLSASVTPNGHTITKVQFLNGTTILGETASAPYNFVWANVPNGTYSVAAQAICDGGSVALSSQSSVTVTSLPAPWQTINIGSAAMTGNALVSGGNYTVAGSGSLNGTADNFQFLYQNLTTDGEISAEVSSVQATNGGACVGAMVRENLTSNSRYALMGLTPSGTFRSQRRSKTGANTSSTKWGNAAPPAAWVRLVRKGNALYGYASTTGTNWTLVNSSSITMATNTYVGLAVASGATNVLNTAVFTNVLVIP